VAGDLTGVSGHGGGAEEAGAAELDQGLDLPRLGYAPDFTQTQSWFNTGGDALTMGGLRGDVVLIDFWTYTCINCIRTLPYVTAWDREYRDDGLTIVGVHSPEFPFEKDAGNVADAIEQNAIEYPVVQDNELGTWTAYGNQYWPAKYLIDAEGQVRFVHFGEGEYEQTEQAIRTLLRERGDEELGGGAQATAETAAPGVTTPETYLGSARAEGWANGRIRSGTQDFGSAPGSLGANQFAFSGAWEVGAEAATAVRDSAIQADFGAEKVFLVLGSPGAARELEVLLDGEPIPDRLAGEDVSGGVARISSQRLYRLIDLPRAGRHRLELRFEPGISGYAFTFG
jgi:thiol-disulfide isomerase/thioredoxin